MLLNIGTIKLTSITQNNHVYEHTAESSTPKVSLNIKSPYRRQKRDLSIIRSSFRRPHTRIEIPAINTITFLPTTPTTSYFLPFYLLATISTTSYLPTFLRSHRLLPTFLRSTTSYLLTTTSTTSSLPTFLRPHRLPTTDIHIVDLSRNNPYSLSQSKPRQICHAQAW
jgi:hypothetical protein